MKIEDIKNTCTACGACVSECPQQCVSLVLDSEGFYYPQIDQDKCIRCGKCERVCHCLTQMHPVSERQSYYGFSLDSSIRDSSTSGGVFAALAKQTVNDGGNVYGAAFDYRELKLTHTSTDHVPVSELQKSKYIESDMGDTIAKIRKDLSDRRKVLFCGTPCQAAGVRNALGTPDGLLICDFICHGVPSSAIFRDYLQTKLRKGEALTGLDFRPKEFGWSDINLKIETVTAGKTKSTVTPYYLDVFYKGFITENAFLRRSCYQCRYRETHCADLTIADFWGYRELDPKLNDEKGLSLIVTHTEHGQKALERLDNFELHPIDNRYSSYAFAPKDYSCGWKKREDFYSFYQPGKLKKTAMKVYMKKYYSDQLKYAVKKILHR